MKPKYKKNEDGTYDVVLSSIKLNEMDALVVENGYPLEIEYNIVDGRKITIKQRKKIFALLNDIYIHTGQPQHDLRSIFQFYLETIKGYDPISLSDCSVTVGRELIEVIISWCFLHHVPLNYKTTDLLKEDKSFLYAATINRNCVICGKTSAQLAHREAVGRGRDRKIIDHYGHHVLALCHEHHTTQHDMGVDSFDKRFHLENAWLKVDDRLNKMLKGRKL